MIVIEDLKLIFLNKNNSQAIILSLSKRVKNNQSYGLDQRSSKLLKSWLLICYLCFCQSIHCIICSFFWVISVEKCTKFSFEFKELFWTINPPKEQKYLKNIVNLLLMSVYTGVYFTFENSQINISKKPNWFWIKIPQREEPISSTIPKDNSE